MSFLRNSWYAGAWSKELAGGPVGRVMLNEPVALYRSDDGAVAALRDVCPHRAVPLSRGRVRADRLVCPYHGLEFDRSGVCRHNPHVMGPADRIKVASYPVCEKHGMVWVWMGEPENADPSNLPEYPWLDCPDRYTSGQGYTKVEADYRLIIDNLLDLAHAEFLHLNTVGSPGASRVAQAQMVRGESSISVNAVWPDLPPSAVFKHVWTKSDRVDQYQNMTWQPAGNLLLDLGIHPPGGSKSDGWHVPSAHILTPETGTSTHYFWAFARDFAIGDDDITRAIVELAGMAFGCEDKPMIEAAQRMLTLTDTKLLDFTVGDRGSSAVRREIERMTSEENSGNTMERDAPGAARPST